jgi:nucleotide-binding universal stress UspA family protein
MIENILFACDFSGPSERAFRYGMDLAERTGATLHCLYVQEVSMGPFVGGNPSPEAGEKGLRAEFVEKCETSLQPQVQTAGVDEVSYAVERASAVAPAVVQFVDTHDMDLVVMGTHGRRGVRRALFGSVAEEVLRTAPCPVLTARGQEDPAPPSSRVSRIVAPVDFSEPSRHAVRYAARLTSVYDVPLTLLHVVELPKIPTVYEVEFSDADPQEVAARVEAELEEWAASVATEGTVSTAVETGDSAEGILRVADAPDDLIVMATRGTSGVKRTMLGSVAEGVLRGAVGPVISCRAFPEWEGRPGSLSES